MQTWSFDYNLEKCFVEREHAYTDFIGDNLVEENLELGDIINHNVGNFEDRFENYSIIVAVSEEKGQGTWDPADGEMVNGVYTAAKYYRCNGASAANQLLFDYTKDNKSEAVISVFMMPTDFAETTETGEPVRFNETFDKAVGILGVTQSQTFYTPRNKKLLTYPYSYITVVNSDGESNIYKEEFFSTSDMSFDIEGVVNTIPEYQVVPKHYKNANNNRLEALRLNSSIQCAYAIDSYRAWIAQRKYPLGLGYVASLGSVGLGGAQLYAGASNGWTSGAHSSAAPNMLSSRDFGVGNIKRGVAGVLGIVAAVKQASTLPDSIRSSNSNVLSISTKWYGFHAYRSQITPQYAKIIDDFFDRYGYATRRNKYPDTHVRQSWTYTKTIDCTITGSLPADDAAKICSIYDSGITFWVNGNRVGDYSQNNSPLGGGD